MQPASPLLLRPPGATWGGGTACSPFALVQGARGHDGIGVGSHTGGLGTSSWCIRDPDPAEGVPSAGPANRHATIIEGRQRGQDRRPQAWVIAKRRDVLGEYQGLRTKVSPVIPHQEFQLVPGQIGTRPALDPTDVIRAGEPIGQARPPLQRRDPALQEIADHVHRCQATHSQDLDPVQYGQELWREGWLGPPLLAVERGPLARQEEAVVGRGASNYPVAAPIFPPRTTKGGDVDYDWIWPRLKVVGTDVVPSLPELDQHEEVAEEGSAGGHTYEHLVDVDEDCCLEDGVGCEVLKLKPELLQQQQEEGRNQQHQPTRDVGGEQHELPDGEIAKGGSAGTDSSGEP
jgi:hypothetical protein